MAEQILQQEDTVSADRKQRIIFDPEAWKKSDKSGRTITSVTSRQNFNNAKYGNRKNKDDDEDDIKEEKSQIKFVTGNDAIATQVGQEKMKKDKVKKIAEAVIKKAVQQISIDKNVGIKEIPTNESTNENAVDMVNESTRSNAAYSHIRSLARKAMSESLGADGGDPHAVEKYRDARREQDAEDAKKKPSMVHVHDENDKVVHKFKSTGGYYGDVKHAQSKGYDPEGKHSLRWHKEEWEPEKETKKPNTPDDAKLKADAKKNKEALDKISKAFAKKKVDEEVNEAELDSLINEVLSADAAASEWIHDFVHSDNAKFAGKSKAKRKEMALAAYYAKQRNEEFNGLEENSDHDSYFTAQKHKESAEKARKSGDHKLYHMSMAAHHDSMAEWSAKRGRHHVAAQHEGKAQNHEDWANQVNKEEVEINEGSDDQHFSKQTPKMQTAINLHLRKGKSYKDAVAAASKHVKEDVEQIDELKKSTLGSYIQKASADASYHANIAGFEAGKKQPKYNTSDDTPTEKKRAKGIATAVKKLTKEDVEQIDELSKTTLGNYIKGASKDASTKILTGATKGNNKDLTGANKDFKTAAKRNSGIKKAVDKLTKEGNDMSKLTFKQFVENLDEMVEFVVTNEEVEQILEYTPGAGGVTKVSGKSYGANYHDPEGDDDADDKPAAKPAETAAAPAAKKGRGRPSGSYGSYKARSAETRAAAAAKSAASKAANKAAK